MLTPAASTLEMWKIFNLMYRGLFPKEWVIRLYAQEFYRVEVIPDMGKPLKFVLGLGRDRSFYELAAKYFKEQI